MSEASLYLVDSVSVRFKHIRVEKMPLNIRIQWNAGTAWMSECPFFGIVQKVFSEKASATARMRQKCVKNASKWVFFYWEKRNVSGQNCVKNASKMRGTPLGENTFWTIPSVVNCRGGEFTKPLLKAVLAP